MRKAKEPTLAYPAFVDTVFAYYCPFPDVVSYLLVQAEKNTNILHKDVRVESWADMAIKINIIFFTKQLKIDIAAIYRDAC